MTGKKRSWPRRYNELANKAYKEYKRRLKKSVIDTSIDKHLDFIRERMEKSDASLQALMCNLKMVLNSKARYQEKIDDDRKELESMKRKIKKKEAEFRKRTAKAPKRQRGRRSN